MKTLIIAKNWPQARQWYGIDGIDAIKRILPGCEVHHDKDW
jgi:hypothetical protein